MDPTHWPLLKDCDAKELWLVEAGVGRCVLVPRLPEWLESSWRTSGDTNGGGIAT